MSMMPEKGWILNKKDKLFASPKPKRGGYFSFKSPKRGKREKVFSF
jgi:hypothetical protein